jgi:hypothetical protein
MFLIKKAKSWARKRIIISTPNGYTYKDDLYGNPFQEHKSGYRVRELEKLGFKVFGIYGWKKT